MPPKELKPGAVFIADAHYHDERRELFQRLERLLDSPPPQLFLMGDIFDLLIGNFSYLMEKNAEVIRLIEALGEQCEVYYIEGNHDFLLAGKIKNITYVSLARQPVYFSAAGLRVAIAHGDYDENPTHTLFTKLIRNPLFITLLHIVTLNFLGNWFVKKVERGLKKKKLCKPFKDFEAFIAKKIKKNLQNADVVIEGHYHQGCGINLDGKQYYNVPGFACNQSNIVVESIKDKIVFDEKRI